MNEHVKNIRTTIGKVVSDKMDKTDTVLVERKVKHPLYGKFVRKSTKIHAHDADNQCTVGDVVRIAEGRPISKTKAWKVIQVLEKAKVI